MDAGRGLVADISGTCLKEQLDQLLGGAVKRGDVPEVVAVLGTGKKILYEGAFGKQNVAGAAPVNLNTVYWIASMTKTLTSIAALQLWEQGKVDLDKPASYWLPELAVLKVLTGFDAQGKPILRQPKCSVTLRHLLTHTSGFGYKFMSNDLLHYMDYAGLLKLTGFKNATLRVPLLFDPGERWNYGISMDWAAKLIEKASGLEFGVYLRQNILQPLGMDSTAFCYTPEMAARKTDFYVRDAAGTLLPQAVDQTPQEYEFASGGGGLWSTARDYLQLCQMFLNQGKAPGGKSILRPETIAQMFTPAMGKLKVTAIKSSMPIVTNNVEFYQDTSKTWSLSWLLNEQETATGRSAGSAFWGGLMNTYFWIDRTRDLTGIFMTQILPFGDVKALPLFYAFEKLAYAR